MISTVASASWPLSSADSLPALAGFVESTFSPLVAEVARRVLTDANAPAQTAIIIVSRSGDAASARYVERAVAAGKRPGPLLFFQAVPNAVGGYIAARWNLAGPVVCLAPDEPGDTTDGLALADLLISDGDAEAALIISVEQGSHDGGQDTARALLVKGEQT